MRRGQARLVKAPKVAFGDSGLLCHLLGLDAARLQGDDLMAGAALETFVAGELTRQIGWSETRPSLCHYRTHGQQEVDFVLENAREARSPWMCPHEGIRRGDIVTVVEHDDAPIPAGEPGCSVEVFSAPGKTIAILTLPESHLEALRDDEVLSVRAWWTTAA
ncbi:MAG: DUF4143 domain-containing protein [Opitutaceae bacterium]